MLKKVVLYHPEAAVSRKLSRCCPTSDRSRYGNKMEQIEESLKNFIAINNIL